jgi:hypothetical protein
MKKEILFSLDKEDLKQDIKKLQKENKQIQVGSIVKEGKIYKVTILRYESII